MPNQEAEVLYFLSFVFRLFFYLGGDLYLNKRNPWMARQTYGLKNNAAAVLWQRGSGDCWRASPILNLPL
jgi:hypothetical protein